MYARTREQHFPNIYMRVRAGVLIETAVHAFAVIQ